MMIAEWDKLPHIVVSTIASHGDWKTHLALKSVCKRWWEALSSNSTTLPAVDVRTVSELAGVENADVQIARLAYLSFKSIVGLVGGWEKYYQLPEFNMTDKNWPTIQKWGVVPKKSLTELQPSELPATVVRGKNAKGFHHILFRNMNTFTNKPTVGFLGQFDLEDKGKRYSTERGAGWLINFGWTESMVLVGGSLQDPFLYEADNIFEHQSRVELPQLFLPKLFKFPVATPATYPNAWDALLTLPDFLIASDPRHCYRIVLWNGPNEIPAAPQVNPLAQIEY